MCIDDGFGISASTLGIEGSERILYCRTWILQSREENGEESLRICIAEDEFLKLSRKIDKESSRSKLPKLTLLITWAYR